MLVKGDISGLLLAGLKTQFFQTFTETPSLYDRCFTIIPSDKDTEHYAWLGALPSMNEFLDERQVGEFSEYEYQIKNKTWESTVAVDRTAIEDDQYGQVAMRVKQLSMEAKQHLDYITFGLLANGFTSACYDGQNFFTSAHPLGKNSPLAGTTQSNTVASGDDNSPLSGGAIQNALISMMRTKNDQGRPMGIIPDTLLVSPENHFAAQEILASVFYPDAVTVASGVSQILANNPLKGLLKVETSPYLPSETAWFLLDTKRPVRSIFLQMRREFEFEALEMNSETGFLRDKYMYGVRGRYNAGFGDWRSAFGSLGT
jgi:phage major head subunit gpT-like protein